MIIAMRELGPDPCVSLSSPQAAAPVSANLVGGVLTPGNTYYVQATQLTLWGESLGSVEQTVVIAGGQNGFTISVSSSPGAAFIRVYVGTQTGVENQYIQVTATPGVAQTVNFTGAGTIGGSIPFRGRAYLPDSDGSFASGVTAYRWLSEALLIMSKASGGVYDFTGMPSSNGQPLYTLIGQWESVDHAWYDGWIMDIGNKSQIYYRNRIATSIAGLMVAQRVADSMSVELFPQPNRTANIATTQANISATDTSVALNISNFVLPMGLCLFGSAGSGEIAAYAFNSGSSLTGLVRGCGGTIAQAWPQGTVVTELNIRVAGRRIVLPYTVGSSASTIPVPPEWQVWIPHFMLSRFREAEGDRRTASDLRKEFLAEVEKMGRANKQRVGPRQIGSGPQVGEVYGGTLGGGWLLP